ncbi:2-hydroxyacyl-CoA dehydratase [Dyella sp. KRB-257]|uniref:2-hydroxyacyl-CoA dehydratase n=1 Tax=Dyella sp. KRB-257 TaxID=3400915 RepID=UPI003C04686C
MSSYDFRQFQAELAALDATKAKEKPVEAPAPAAAPAAPKKRGRPSTKAAEAERLARVREEFLALRARHDLTVADVVAFFPEEEGIAYLQSLLAQPQPRRRRRKADAE